MGPSNMEENVFIFVQVKNVNVELERTLYMFVRFGVYKEDREAKQIFYIIKWWMIQQFLVADNEKCDDDPFFKQVVEVSRDGDGDVTAVAWSPGEKPCGEVAVSLANCIGVFSHSSRDLFETCSEFQVASSFGSFCWSQTAILVQATKVEAIKWSGSGDGLVSVGIDVVLWRKKEQSWEIAWKFKPDVPQFLASTTFCVEGPFATAPLNKPQTEGSTSVLICHGNSKRITAELHHHVPVSMIQWRPLVANQSKENSKHPLKLVLLTCCADGTVRLWSEIDDGRARKTVKAHNDHKPTGSSFQVAATIEINQAVNGILGSDVFVRWATELDGIVNVGKETSQYFPSEEYHHGKAGKCDWLICFGPQLLVTFWAVHCIDDFSPLRFPRVTLWKRRELSGSKTPTSFPLHKPVISRNGFFGPPDVSSVIHLLRSNHLLWSQFYKHESSEDSLSSIANGTLNIDGHSAKILQIALHPYGCYSEIAVSLDTNGVILFWSLSNSAMGFSPLNSGYKLSGQFVAQDSHCKYTSLRWAPTIMDDHRVLLMGHAAGIDSFLVKVSQNEDLISCHKLCTIPLTDNNENGPSSIWSIPLTSTCSTFLYNSFMVLAVWKDHFQALSWKVTIHPSEIGLNKTAESGSDSFESCVSEKKYCIYVDHCSSTFPDPFNYDNITSFAVLGLYSIATAKVEEQAFNNYVAYHMVTGCLDGSLKLWRSMVAKSPSLDQEWELVGMVAGHEGPITRVSPTDCGGKIATISNSNELKNHSILHIWESVYLGVTGSFLLEDTIKLDGEVVALNWFTIGNGQLLLGVCLHNELRVYSMRRCGGQSFESSEKSKDRNMWFCLAKTHTRPAIRDFIWGPKATCVLVHDDYFCLFSQWLLPSNNKHISRCMLPQIFSDSDTPDLEKLTLKDSSETRIHSIKMNMENCIFSHVSGSDNQKYNTSTEIGFENILEIAAHVGGSLPTYHPEALLVNIYSGNWKRARSALGHLFEHLTSSNTDLKRNPTAKYGHRIPQIRLSDYVEGLLTPNSNSKAVTWSGGTDLGSSSSLQSNPFSYSNWDSTGSINSYDSSSTRSGLSRLADSAEKLQNVSAITNIEKMQILAVVDLLDEISNSNASSPYGGLDEPGRRFWVAVRFQQLYCVRRLGKLPSVGELVIDSSLIAWAFHSDCQESLFESLLNNESSWQDMRSMGVGFWYTNKSQLRVKMERLAKKQYLEKRDPKACALLYIALNRLQVLAGLFKISKDEKDKPLVAFLSRNFQDEKNKAAALKNAYVLMGRHQLELAVAFFLLGGDTASAMNVCTKTLGDEQLALVICRLLEGNGGPSEHHIVSKFLLPNAYENGEYWKSSFLEWGSGNYSKAFVSMLGEQVNSPSNKFAILSNHAAFMDSSVGQYCMMLTTKNQMKNAIGEQNTVILGRWAVLMSSTALSRCGLPIEALECLSSSVSMFTSEPKSASDNSEPKVLNEILRPSSSSSNWISGDVALHMLSHAKYGFAMQCITNLLMEHPSWPENITSLSETQQYNTLLSTFENKLSAGISYFEQKYSLISHHLINMIAVSLYNYGLMFIGCHILQHERFALNVNPSYPSLPMLVLKGLEDFSYLFSRYNVACLMNCHDIESHVQTSVVAESSCCWLSSCTTYIKDLLLLMSKIRSGLKLLCGSYAENILQAPLFILDLCEYYIYFASAWFQKDSKSLILVLKPILLTHSNESVSFETNLKNLNEILPELSEWLDHKEMTVQTTSLPVNDRSGHVIPEHDKWQIIRASLWGLMSGFLKYQIESLPENLGDTYSVSPPCKLSSYMSSFTLSNHDNDSKRKQFQFVSVVLAKLLKVESGHALSYCAKQLASYMLREVRDQTNEPTILWLEDLCRSTSVTNYQGLGLGIDFSRIMNNEDGLSGFDVLWSMFDDQKVLCGDFAVEYSKWSQLIKQKHSKGWSDVYKSITGELEASDNDQEVLSPVDHSGGKESAIKMKHTPFQKPKEVHKTNGELLEALCINSIDQQQAAIASNKKGIVFFNWEDGRTCFDRSNYIWTDVDWPTDGWAGSESTPVPTCVSPGIGLGSRKGTHLGLGGATIGVGLARPSSTSNLGWEIQEDFEELIDPPATVDNIRTRAFSSHPSRPFFLVGSSNTHVYLWEFGKSAATATYGVLPAANVPPPYALASISAVEFDHCGQRFATAASDGTVCTWQLEVGGRSNVRPTESSLCFNNYTSDVTYVTSSGSIVAAVGYSSNNVNVVIWDTLAPPATSRASIMCHEGS
ncbi:transducin family protein / WD-40 repeat family protein [Artemisia annua]|uniref:Transducin family protein / WD-40 repeat family protein n=1 Tax=Artemisia annua TaxID=35608 RepID=A0A2U1M7A8_ARTAN|nr:transducin family protein / WD-40 repeat family protein [Artemisia annua]